MSQWHFEFKDWKAAFKMFYRKKGGETIKLPSGSKARIPGNKAICLVISTAEFTSGYWVEENAKTDATTKVYRSVRAVRRLEADVRARVAEQEDRTVRPRSTGLIT
jgi:hypothetical protein